MKSLKAEFLQLLDKDVEFRYAVAGYLGLSEILKRLDSLAEEQVKLREEQSKLREDFNRMLEVVKELQEGQRRLEEEYRRLEEGHKELQEGQRRLERRLDSLESAMVSGFGEVSKFAGLTFEEFVRKFLTASLRKSGEIPEGVELTKGLVEGEEIDIFLEDPLIVGEVTGYAESTDELEKLLKKAKAVKAKYFKEPRKILAILTAKEKVMKEIRKKAEEEGVELIVGKVVD